MSFSLCKYLISHQPHFPLHYVHTSYDFVRDPEFSNKKKLEKLEKLGLILERYNIEDKILVKEKNAYFSDFHQFSDR